MLALRADRLADLSAYPGFARLIERGLYLLGPLDTGGLRAAIERPARQAGLVVEPGLVDLLVSDIGDDPGALPLLSHALQETWVRREGRTLTVDGYRASGGIRGSVAQSAEGVYASVPPEQRDQVRELMLRLVSPGTAGGALADPRSARSAGHAARARATRRAPRVCAARHRGRRSGDAHARVTCARLATTARLARGRPRRPGDPAPPGGERRRLARPGPARERALPGCPAGAGAGVGPGRCALPRAGRGGLSTGLGRAGRPGGAHAARVGAAPGGVQPPAPGAPRSRRRASS